MKTPEFEIWYSEIYPDETGKPEFGEDCLTIEDARKAVLEWRKEPYLAVWIQDKESGKKVE